MAYAEELGTQLYAGIPQATTGHSAARSPSLVEQDDWLIRCGKHPCAGKSSDAGPNDGGGDSGLGCHHVLTAIYVVN
ncbi:hypothetical protein GCM10017767_31490 [Halomonas urumqiensis]|nr:hypothetical protein GCM10017767_31490 [Halomonas urumqiensis]